MFPRSTDLFPSDSPQLWWKVRAARCSFISCSSTDMRCSILLKWYRDTSPTRSCKCPGWSSLPNWPLPTTWTPSTARTQTTSTEPSSGEAWSYTCNIIPAVTSTPKVDDMICFLNLLQGRRHFGPRSNVLVCPWKNTCSTLQHCWVITAFSVISCCSPCESR